jgi:predicted RNase H-like HicB family nuclease
MQTRDRRALRAVFTRDGEGWHASVVDVPGCRTWGPTLDAARLALREALSTCEDVFDDPDAVAASAVFVEEMVDDGSSRRGEAKSAPLHVTRAVPAGDLRLALTFSDGSSGVADLTALVDMAGYTRLRDATFFASFVVNDGTVEWGEDGEVDIAPEVLYALAHGLPLPRSLGEVAHAMRRVGESLRGG